MAAVRHMNKPQRGFTLIELVVVIVIVGILASIAIPSYREYVVRGNRRAAQASMMEIATRQQQYFVANRSYATKAQLGYTLPPEVTGNYTFDIALAAGPPPTFTVNFTAVGAQAGDGNLALTSNGVKTPADKWTK
jgi:type IV pilus assembly protein PilE